jgi:hypothetical protein
LGIPEKWIDAVRQLKDEHKASDDEITTWFPDHVPTEAEIEDMRAGAKRLVFCVMPEEAASLQDAFAKRFRVLEWFVFPGAVICSALSLHETQWVDNRMWGSVEQRHEQIRTNSARVKKRIEPPVPAHDRRCAIVCYGPSLASTWVGVIGERKYQNAALVTVSGAHDFMIARNLVPDYHFECDPREHKAVFTEKPHSDVKYYIASCVHPKLVDNLLGHDLTLFHSNNGQEDFDLIQQIEPGELLVNGGGSVAFRAIYAMHMKGYRTFSMYGMDFSYSDHQHAGKHPNEKTDNIIEVKCGERWFRTTPVLVSYAKQFLMIVKALSDSEFFLHGDGLMQHMGRISAREAA